MIQHHIRLKEEVKELFFELNTPNPNFDAIMSECCDVQNFAMFIYDIAKSAKGLDDARAIRARLNREG